MKANLPAELKEVAIKDNVAASVVWTRINTMQQVVFIMHTASEPEHYREQLNLAGIC